MYMSRDSIFRLSTWLEKSFLLRKVGNPEIFKFFKQKAGNPNQGTENQTWMMKRVTHCCAVQEQQPIDAKRRKTLVDVSGNSPHAEAESCTATNRSAKVALASNQRNLLSATANTVISFNRQQSAEVAPIFIDLDLPLDSCSVSNVSDSEVFSYCHSVNFA